MEILQLPVLELQERIDQEMTENPVLEELEQEQLELEGAEALAAAEQSTQDEGEQELSVRSDTPSPSSKAGSSVSLFSPALAAERKRPRHTRALVCMVGGRVVQAHCCTLPVL